MKMVNSTLASSPNPPTLMTIYIIVHHTLAIPKREALGLNF
jgi:hypothetical protein